MKLNWQNLKIDSFLHWPVHGMHNADCVRTLEMVVVGSVDQAAGDKGGAVLEVPVLSDRIDAGLE